MVRILWYYLINNIINHNKRKEITVDLRLSVCYPQKYIGCLTMFFKLSFIDVCKCLMLCFSFTTRITIARKNIHYKTRAIPET